jgi:hypothetical protein
LKRMPILCPVGIHFLCLKRKASLCTLGFIQQTLKTEMWAMKNGVLYALLENWDFIWHGCVLHQQHVNINHLPQKKLLTTSPCCPKFRTPFDGVLSHPSLNKKSKIASKNIYILNCSWFFVSVFCKVGCFCKY